MAKATKPEHKATPLVYCDFETGGLDPKTCAITEIALVVIAGDTCEEIGRYESLVYPYYDPKLEYNPKALEITGITIEALKAKGKPIKEVASEVIKLVDGARASHGDGKSHKPVFHAHNASFDLGFLQHLMHYGDQMKAFEKCFQGKHDFYGNFVPLVQDTIVLAKYAWSADRTMANYKLETCVNKVGIGLNDAHRAMNDIVATKDFGVEIIKRARQSGGSLSTTSEINHRKHFQF